LEEYKSTLHRVLKFYEEKDHRLKSYLVALGLGHKLQNSDMSFDVQMKPHVVCLKLNSLLGQPAEYKNNEVNHKESTFHQT
jgi:hypothetical protein